MSWGLLAYAGVMAADEQYLNTNVIFGKKKERIRVTLSDDEGNETGVAYVDNFFDAVLLLDRFQTAVVNWAAERQVKQRIALDRSVVEKAVHAGLYPGDVETFPYEMLAEHRNNTTETKMMWAKITEITDQVMGVVSR